VKKSEKIDWEKTTNFMGIKRNIMTSNTSNQQHRTPATNYGGPECPDAVWEMGTPISGKNPDEWRLDVNGNIIRKSHRGKRRISKYSWDIDHIIPQASGGSHSIDNLQPVQSSKNRSMGKSMKEKQEAMQILNNALKIKAKKYESSYGNAHKKHPGFILKSSIGKTFWVKQCPISRVPAQATILDYNIEKKWIDVFWTFENYKQRLYLEKSLFEAIPEGRPRRHAEPILGGRPRRHA
jgi:hypothetical protein